MQSDHGLSRNGAWKRAGRVGAAERDLIALGIAVAAIVMFVGTGSAVLPRTIAALTGDDLGPDRWLTNALLLNIALIVFGWRRYRDLEHEVAERRAAEEAARRLAQTDPLTGFLNRRHFHVTLHDMCVESQARGRAVAVMMIDIDNFKRINDGNGHAAGDRALLATAQRLAAILPPSAVLARIGGDEFACAASFPQDSAVRIDALGAALVAAIAEPVCANGRTIELSASLGIATTDESEGAPDANTLLERADLAMYHGKRNGRNAHHWFDPAMAEEMDRHARLEAGLRTGLERGEFVPFYEQQIDVQTGRVVGFEMLARWNSPDLGLVLPDVFIPLAEKLGVIGDLFDQLLMRALTDAGEWDPSLTLAINVSPLQLRDPWFTQRLLKALVLANFPPARLEIEITESCIHENVGLVRTLMTSMKNQGIRVSLDDFGTGYSSLAQLRSLPFDRIKVDRSFVSAMADDDGSAQIVAAISALGKGLGLPLTLEGIESRDVLDRLQSFGEIKGQGYLYGQPECATLTREKLGAMGLLACRTESAAPLGNPEGTLASAAAFDNRHVPQRAAGSA